MSEYDDLIPTEEELRQAAEKGPESKDAHLEGKLESLPALVSAADLLEEEEPLASIPVEPPDEETPPDEAAPAFIVTPMKGRPPRITLANGTPVGVWLHEEHSDKDGGQVAEMLVIMGMDGDLAAWYGIQRDRAREATTTLQMEPAVAAFQVEEERRKVEKKKVQDAFVEAQRKKESK